jgi:hypothetical protein
LSFSPRSHIKAHRGGHGKRIVPGTEIITDPSFDTAEGWDTFGTIYIEDGMAIDPNNGQTPGQMIANFQPPYWPAGKYRFTMELVNAQETTLSIIAYTLGTPASIYFSDEAGTIVRTFTATAPITRLELTGSADGKPYTINSLSIVAL